MALTFIQLIAFHHTMLARLCGTHTQKQAKELIAQEERFSPKKRLTFQPLKSKGTNYTYTFWIRLNRQHEGQWRSIFLHGEKNMDRFPGVWLRPHDDRLMFRQGTTKISNDGFDSEYSLPLNQWVHLAIVLDGRTFSCTINGTVVEHYRLKAPARKNEWNILVGSIPRCSAAHCDIKNFRVYNYALHSIDMIHEDIKTGLSIQPIRISSTEDTFSRLHLVADKKLSDVSLIMPNNTKIPGHRAILSLGSRYFDKIFSRQDIEDIEVPIQERDVLICILQLIYSSCVPSVAGRRVDEFINGCCLLKVNMHNVNEKFSNMLMQHVDDNNIGRYFEFAAKCRYDSLVDKLMEYIDRNRHDVFSNPTFKENLSKSTLMYLARRSIHFDQG